MGVAKRPLDTVDLTEASPKRHQPEAINHTLSTEGILSRIALSDLKSCFREMLSDPLCGPFIEAHLQTYAGKSLEAELERTKKQVDDLRKKAGAAIAEVEEHAQDPKNYIFEIGDLGDAIAPFLEPARELWRTGSETNAPALVFELLMGFADWIIWPEDGESKAYGDNGDNDHVHEEIESILVGVVREELESCEDPQKWIQRVETKDRLFKVNRPNNSINDLYEPCHRYTRLQRLLVSGIKQDKTLPTDMIHLGQESRWAGEGLSFVHTSIPSIGLELGSDDDDDEW
ncbi:hypothetical protein K4K57_000915 [Colletotrichum sp. SAR 10_99]|nr:hypothetical protein K4K57_000915 [Colletotrichum sp. SAR 10_99]